MKAGNAATRSDRINPGVPAKYPVATLRYAPGFHGKNAILHAYRQKIVVAYSKESGTFNV